MLAFTCCCCRSKALLSIMTPDVAGDLAAGSTADDGLSLCPPNRSLIDGFGGADIFSLMVGCEGFGIFSFASCKSFVKCFYKGQLIQPFNYLTYITSKSVASIYISLPSSLYSLAFRQIRLTFCSKASQLL